jgi:type IV pilus assembly protein PilY1
MNATVLKFPSFFGFVCSILMVNITAHAELMIPNIPLGVTMAAKPMTLITAGKDHKLFYEAYNDASDIDGDGTLDIRFKPSITYYGLFDSDLCYTYSGSDNSGLFSPDSVAGADYKCPGKWSGNFLNYLTTSRIDAMRKVLYGGHREVDSTNETILRRTYLPQDAHSWGKEYKDLATDGYLISNYTPLAQPTSSDRRHFFGNLTANRSQSCATLDNCSNLPPLLRIRRNVPDNVRIWQWASKERPVLHDTISTATSQGASFPSGTGNEQNFTVRVRVCTATFKGGCKQYPNGTYKPIGLLHEYGENDAMLFGLLTGSYDKHMSGGRLRKVISSFKNEIDADTGQFTSNATLVDTFNKLRIRGFNQSSDTSEYWKSNPYADSAKAPTQGQLVDWGNPIGEMMYEAVRYLAGKKSATSSFSTGINIDTAVGLSSATWDDPYDTVNSEAKAPWCARANLLTISDINTSFDSDTVPGSSFNSFSGDLSGLNVTGEANVISSQESDIAGPRFIGQAGDSFDSAPTVKNVTSLGNIRGLAPEEPNKQGSYYSASIAYFAKTNNLRSAPAAEKQNQIADTFVVALTSPLPHIRATLTNGSVVTLVPFAKSVGGSGISATKGDYQPTDQIVDFYVETIANSGAADADASVNGGRYYAKFRINYEDVEQGGDHDMDAIAEYEIAAQANGTLRVKVTPTYQAGGIQQNMGYVISGTTQDGVYLVVQDENVDITYYLNTPPGLNPGACDVTTPPASCKKLPYIGSYSERIFSAGGGTGVARLLNDPLWYAAKWGGFIDRNNNDQPDLTAEWDADSDGVPDTYFLVQNPLRLKESLRRAFDNIVERSASAGNVTSNSTAITTDTQVFQSLFNTAVWSGNLLAYPVSDAGVGVTPNWQAADTIPLPNMRRIYTVTGGGAQEFIWGNLSAADKSVLVSEEVVNYLRGARNKELQNGGTLRNRTSHVLGDIVHSSPYYVKDNNTVFVGANDGMLHAFDGNSGVELFAYIPSQALARLKKLSEVDYGETNNPHQYFVDGDMAVSTREQTANHNYLAATLGHGGKGLFGLNVTNPGSFGPGSVLWEYFNSTDNDLGYMIGRPVIARMNDDSTVVIVGNGYNSTDGKAVLYIFDLVSGSLVKKLDTLVAGDNGLASPGVIDSNEDGKIDFIYAGDLKGNVWKFDVSGSEKTSWNVAFESAGIPEPLYVAKDASGIRQPITAQITVAVNHVAGDLNYGKRFVFFGTGSYFRTGDPNDLQVQTWYGLIDEDAQITDRSDLKQRTIFAEGTFTDTETLVRTFSEAVAGDMSGKKGWYLELTQADGTPEGERIVTSSKIYRLAESTLIASSLIPVIDPCIPGGKGFVNAISPFTGARLSAGFFDISGNNNFTDDTLNDVLIGSVDLDVGMPSEPVLVGNRLVVGGSKAITKSIRINLGSRFKGRISWHEILQN